MNTYKKRFFMLIGIAVLLPSALVGINWYLDPAEIYHKSFFRPQCATFRTVETTAGRINHYLDGHDGVIFGSSLSTNFETGYLKNITGKTFFMAARDGVAAKSMDKIVRHLFRKEAGNQIKTVWWELYHQKLAGEDFVKDNFTTYLFNDDITDDLPYLLSFGTVQKGIKVIQGKCSTHSTVSWRGDLRHQKTQETYHAPEQLQKLNDRISDRQKELQNYRFKQTDTPAIDNYVLPVIREYPEKEYVFYVPPTSLAALVFFKEAELNRYFSMIGRLAEEAEKNPNIRIYLPVWDKALITNAGFYRDDLHYVGEINDRMVRDISEGRNRVTKQNYPAFVAEMTDWIKHEKMK